MIFFLNFLMSFRSTTNLGIQDESYFGGKLIVKILLVQEAQAQ